MKHCAMLSKLICLLTALLLLPAFAYADLGSFSGDEDYHYESTYEEYYVEEDYDEEEAGYIAPTSAEDANLTDMLGSLAVILVVGGSIAGIAILSDRRKKRKEEKRKAESGPKTQLDNMTMYVEYIDPAFDKAAFEQKMSNLYVQFQNAWTGGNIESIRMYFEESLFARLERQLNELKKKGHTNYVERISVLASNAIGYYQTGGEDRIVVRVRSRIVDYTTDASGRVVSGSKTKEKFMIYEWELARSTGKVTGKSSMTVTNCPNCGAPLNVNQSAKCPYCGTIVTADEHDWLITAIHARSQRTGR